MIPFLKRVLLGSVVLIGLAQPIKSQNFGNIPPNTVIGNPSTTLTQPARPMASSTQAVTPLQFGAKGDGVTDDSAALQAWLNYGVGKKLSCGASTYAFSTPLLVSAASHLNISCEAPFTATFLYTGASTTVDLITIGNVANPSIGLYLSGFRVASNTTMTAGTGLHLINVNRSATELVVIDGQDGNNKLWNGVWFDGDDQITFGGGSTASGQNDAVRISNSDSVFLNNMKIAPPNGTTDSVCVHIGGGSGGINIGDGTSIINCNVNLLIDTTIVSTQNRQIYQQPGSWIDMTNATTGTDGVQINDTSGGSGTIELLGWIYSAKRYGVNVISWAGQITINSPDFGNAGNSCLFVQNGAPSILIGAGVQMFNCGRLGSGYALDASIPVGNVTSHARFGLGNTSGNYNITNLGGSFIDDISAWTPTLVGSSVAGSPTYTYSIGEYERNGRVVTARFSIQTTALGGMSGNVSINGLVLASTSISSNSGGCMIYEWGGVTLAANYIQISGQIGTSTKTVTLVASANNGSSAIPVTAAMLGASTLLLGTCQYQAP